MKNNLYYIVGIIFLIILIVGQVVLKNYKNQINQLSKDLQNSELIRHQLDVTLRDQVAINGKEIEDWLLLGKDGKSVNISDLSTKTKCLFFMFSEYSCFDCVRRGLDVVLKNIKGNIRLIIVCGFSNIHQVLNWALENNFGGEIYLFKDYDRCTFSKTSNYPYLFKINDNLQLVNVYTLSQNIDYLKLYLDTF